MRLDLIAQRTGLMAGRDFNRLLTELYPEEENLFDPSSPFNLAQSSRALRTVRGLVNTACIAVIAAPWVPSPKAPASAVRIACWSRSVNLGALGRPFGLPD